MKTIFFLSIVILTTLISFSQDVIYKKDKTKVDAKVLEVGTSEIKYKSTANPDGPIYSINKSDVILIAYQNGTFDSFSSSVNPPPQNFDSLKINFCRNHVGIDIAEFVTSSVGIVYDRTFGNKGMFALRLPFSVAIAESNFDSYLNGKIFGTGLDFLYFPTGQGGFKYYVAPYFEWGMFRYRQYTGYPSYYNYNALGNHFAGGIKNGFLYQVTRHFSFSADFGLGFKEDQYSSGKDIQPQVKASIILGYRF